MEIPPSPFWPLSLLSAAAMAALAGYVWTRRAVPGAYVLFAALVAIAHLCATATFQEWSPTLAGQVFWLHVQIPAYAAIPVLWLLLTCSHAEMRVTRRAAAALFVIPAIGVLVHWTDHWHHLYWTRIWVDRTGAAIMGRTYGVGFWCFMAYSWLMILVGVFVLLRHLPKGQVQRRRGLTLLGAMLLPLAADTVYVFDWRPIRYCDITPYGFVATGALMVWALFRYRLQGIVPVAARSVVESMGDGVIVLDIDRRVAQINRAAEALLDAPQQGLLGRRACEVFHDFPQLAPYCENDGDLAGDLTFEAAGGRRICAVSGRDVMDAARRIGRVITLHDVTQERAASEQLREARLAAEAAAVAKARFLANMSHEIRTPMNGVVGAAELLLDSELTEEQAELVRTAQESAHALLAILNDILDFSKIDAGRLELDQLPFDLPRLIHDVARLMRPIVAKKKLDLNVRIAPKAPKVIVGDPARLRQVILNLVGNAIKFTAAGWVAIEIDALPSESGGVPLRISVEDTGIGIEPDRMGTLFQEFSQADSSITRNFGGTGLGLVISQRLVHKMGGVIRVESSPGRGSRFTVELPVRLAATRAVEPSAVTFADLPRFPGCRVLMVEDNLVNQKIGQRLLEKLGCSVTVGNSGREAVALAAAASYDVIFMDLHMPDMDGLEATREIRRLGIHSPIVALTASILDDTRSSCHEAGMNGFIAKPIRLDEIASVLAMWRPSATGEPPKRRAAAG